MKKKLPSNYYPSIVIFSAKFLPKNKKDQKNLETEIKRLNIIRVFRK